MQLWIVGLTSTDQEEDDWAFMGVYDDRVKALLAVTHVDMFLAPAILNETLSRDWTEWPGCYYPLLEPDPETRLWIHPELTEDGYKRTADIPAFMATLRRVQAGPMAMAPQELLEQVYETLLCGLVVPAELYKGPASFAPSVSPEVMLAFRAMEPRVQSGALLPYLLSQENRPGDYVFWHAATGERHEGILKEWDNNTAIVDCADGQVRSTQC